MPVTSSLELSGSPLELATWSPATTYYWDPTPELVSGEVAGSLVCTVVEYNPQYSADARDVTTTVLSAGYPTPGTGPHAGQVAIQVKAGALTPGYEYRFELSCVGSLGTAASRFFRIQCRV